MAKFSGLVGYAHTTETSPGVMVEQFTERKYRGDVKRNVRRLQSTDNVNDNITATVEISIVADAYAKLNFYQIRYVIYNGVKWKVTNADNQYPRLILSLGGVYNAE